jgi:hypothetical protein
VGDQLMATKTGNRPYSGRPKTGRSQPTGDFDAPTPAERRRMDEEQSRPFREAYQAGEKAGKDAAKKQGSGAKAKGKGRGSSAARRPARGPWSARTAARQLQAPVRAQVTSGLRVAGITLALVALYNVLTTPGPEAFSGVLGGLSRALQWLAAPTAIPSRK